MADEIVKAATQSVGEDINRTLKGDIEKLKQSSREFLRQIQLCVNVLKGINSEIKKMQYNIKTIYQAMKSETEVTQAFTLAQFDFQEAVNNFFGRKINLIWVDSTTGKMYYADQIDAKEIYITGTKKQGGRATVSVKPEDFKENFDTFIETLGDFGNRIKNHQKNYKDIYSEVLDRWDLNHSKDNSWYYMFENHKFPFRDTFYWKGGDGQAKVDPFLGFSHSAKMNRGNISETYVNILMNDDEKVKEINPSFKPVEENSIRQYWLYMKKYKLLNNIPGIVQGDVILAGQTSLQFAVKEGSFNTATIGPYITTAISILAIDEENNITVEQILEPSNLSKLGAVIAEQMDLTAQDAVLKAVIDILRPTEIKS